MLGVTELFVEDVELLAAGSLQIRVRPFFRQVLARVDCSLNSDYNRPVRQVFFSPDAVRQLERLEARERSLLRTAIERRLREDDATIENRNRFRLRRPSPHADFELRVRSLRLFYRVLGDRVEIVLIGRQRGNELIVDSERFVL